jgi:hypothetical protein
VHARSVARVNECAGCAAAMNVAVSASVIEMPTMSESDVAPRFVTAVRSL